MKTGLITFHYIHHYGAQLQAYAMMKSICNISGDCEIIDYRPNEKNDSVIQKGVSPYILLKNIHSFLHYPALHRRYLRFAAFVDDYMNLSPRKYSSLAELNSQPPLYDCYVCGSDQIWNPYLCKDQCFDKAFFLSFVRKSPKIAYAPSIGAAELDLSMREELKRYLTDFSHLSVREKRGADVLNDVAGVSAPVVLDPTLLLNTEDWASIAGNIGNIKQRYILCYFVSPPGDLAHLAEKIKKRLNASLVQLAGARRRVPGVDHIVFDAGPREFISLFRDCCFVITNSFHGTVFAIQFKKQFACGTGKGESGNPCRSRMGNLLESLGLLDNLYTGAIPDNSKQTDYGKVFRRLESERERSLRYLRCALLPHQITSRY